MRVFTETGSVYLLDNDALTVKRETYTHDLRADGAPLRLFDRVEPVVGEPMTMLLEPLSLRADVTVRITSPVTRVEP